MRFFLSIVLAFMLWFPLLVRAEPNNPHWTEGGGARLYWNGVHTPKQIHLNGASWQDPAQMPLLKDDECAPQKRYSGKKKGKRKRFVRPRAKGKSKAKPVRRRRLTHRPHSSHKLSLPSRPTHLSTGAQVSPPLPPEPLQ